MSLDIWTMYNIAPLYHVHVVVGESGVFYTSCLACLVIVLL